MMIEDREVHESEKFKRERRVRIDIATTDRKNPLPELLFGVTLGGAFSYSLASMYDPENRHIWAVIGSGLGFLGGLLLYASINQ